jgi:ComF family protein
MSTKTTPKRLIAPVTQTVARLGDALVPPACPICTRVLAADDGLCAACWADLDFITGPVCRISGVPLQVDLGVDTVSLPMRMKPPPYDMARAAFIYKSSAAALIKKLKFGDRPELAGFLSGFMALAGEELLTANAVLVPVPLHRNRLLWRRFNQAAELCRALSKLSGNEIFFDAVMRVRPTRQQIGLTRASRKRNLAGAFAVSPKWAAQIKGRTLVLVDDVLTTGATVEAVSRVLKRAGARRVYVLTLARVVMPSQVIIS